jgi:hypothetical protein
MVPLFTAFDLESGVCKFLASVTVLQLHGGDVVKAQQTYLQEHLNIPMYMRSKECEFIDELVLACVNQDDDALDKAKMHPQVNYLDKEIQKLVKELSLFSMIEGGSSSSFVPPPQMKNQLFPKKQHAAEPVQSDAIKPNDYSDLNNEGGSDGNLGSDPSPRQSENQNSEEPSKPSVPEESNDDDELDFLK